MHYMRLHAVSAGIVLLVLFLVWPLQVALAVTVSPQFRQELEPLIARLRGPACQTARPGLSCKTNNPGAVTCASNGRGACTPVVAKFNGLPCQPRQPNDTACFEKVEFGVATMANLIFQKIKKGCNSIYSILEACQYSSRSAGNDSLAYAKTVSGLIGVGINEKMDVNNSVQMGKLVTAMAYVEAGKKNGLGFNVDQLAQGLAYAYGQDALPAGTPGFVPGVGPFVYSGDLSRIPDAGPGMISPFSGQVIGASAVQGAYPSTGATPNGVPTTVPGDVNVETNLTPAGSGGPAAALVAQASTIEIGKAILVSWSSVNMSTNPACQLVVRYADSTEETVGQGNAGSKSIRISPAAPVGAAMFTLRCTSLSGTSVEKTVTVTVQ